VDTGRLRNSISHEVVENDVYIGTNVEYAPYVEYGEYKHTTGKNHFLRDAATNHSEHYKKIMEAALKA
jgi:phage gpG-like protein